MKIPFIIQMPEYRLVTDEHFSKMFPDRATRLKIGRIYPAPNGLIIPISAERYAVPGTSNFDEWVIESRIGKIDWEAVGMYSVPVVALAILILGRIYL